MDPMETNNASEEVSSSHFLPNSQKQFVPAENIPQASSNTTMAPIIKPISENDIKAIRKSAMEANSSNSMADFFKDLGDFKPTIPDPVALYYMQKNGIAEPDPKLLRLFSLAAQKFVSDIALDAMQQARIKGLGVKKGARETRYSLTNELLDQVLQEYGIETNKPPYYQ